MPMKNAATRMAPLWLVGCVFGIQSISAQTDEATALLQSLDQVTDSTVYVDALNRLAMISYEKSADTTFYYTIRARALAERLNYSKGKADALNNLGVVYDIKGNQQLALKYYNDAHQAYSKIDDAANCVQTLMNMAGVYKQLGRDERSLGLFELAFDEGYKLSHDSILSLVIYNYLLVFPERSNQAQTDQYIADASAIATRYQDTRTLIALDHLAAKEQIKRGDRQAGLAIWDSIISLAIEKQLYYVSMDMLVGIGDLVAQDDPTQAAVYYRRGLEIANDRQYLFYSRAMARKLFDLHTTLDNQQEAGHYSRLLVEVVDKQEQLDNSASIDYLDYALKEQQLERLVEKSRNQTVLLIMALLGCLLAIGVILAIRRTLWVSKQLNAQIVAQNQHMQKTLDALEQSQAENSRMMHVVAHDLRNPIGAIGSAASLLLEEGSRPEVEQQMLELIGKSATDSLNLVTNLLEVNKAAGDMPKDLVDMGQLLRYCVDLMESRAAAKNQRITLRSEPVTISANREKLWRVTSNLIANAIKFSPHGEEIDVSLDVNEQSILVAVKDRGIGIPEPLASKVFNMFTEAKRPGTDGEEPFGLGLAISKHIVEAHGGRIWFESQGNQTFGTTFFIELPRSSANC